MRPLTFTVPRRRLGDAGDELQQRALARAVPADDAERPPLGHGKRHVAARAANVSSGRRLRDQAARQQRALQRRELLALAVAAVDFRRVVTSIAACRQCRRQLPVMALVLGLELHHTSSANVSRSRSNTQ